MKKKIIILLVLMFITTGCTSYTELNELSIVNTLGIDYVDNQYQLIINVMNGELDDDKIEKNIITYSSLEETLDKTFQYIYTKSSKKLYLSHIDLLILTEDAINSEFRSIISNFLENNEYRNNFNVVLLKDISLKEFMNYKIPAEEINNLINTNYKETAISKPVDFESVIKDLLIDSNTYLPTITYSNDKIQLQGFTLIRNYKVYEQLSLKESILLNILNNYVNKSYINGNNILFNQTHIKTKNNHIYFQFTTHLLKDNHYEQDIKNDLLIFLKKYQNNNYDVLKLLERVRKNDYSYYQKTNNLLQQLTFDFNFDIKIKQNYLQGDEF